MAGFNTRNLKRAPLIDLTNSTVEEGSAPKTVGTLSVTRTGYTLSIISDPDNKFTLSGMDLITDGVTNFNNSPSHLVTIRASKAGQPDVDEVFLISVIEVENPVDTTITAPNGMWWTFEGEVENGTYITGDPWVVAPVGGLPMPIAYSNPPTGTGTGVRNGGMINPTFNTLVERSPMPFTPINLTAMKQGYDGRATQSLNTMEYDEAYNAHVSATELNAGDSLVSCESYRPEDLSLPGSNQQAIARMAILTVVDSAPEADAFRPNYFGTTKINKRWSDVNTALLPNLSGTNPKGTASDKFHIDEASVYVGSSGSQYTSTERMIVNSCRYPQYWIVPWGGNSSQSLLKPVFHMDWYPRDNGITYGRLAAYVMYNFADRDVFLKNILQIAIDCYAIAADATPRWAPFGGGAGFYASPLWLIRLAGLLFNDNDMKNAASISTGRVDFEDVALPKWGELARCYYSTTAHAQYLVPDGLDPENFPLFGDPPFSDVSGGQGSNGTVRDPDQVYDMVGWERISATTNLPTAAYPNVMDDVYDRWEVGGIQQTNLGLYMKDTNRAMMGNVMSSMAMGDEAFWGGAVVDFARRHAADAQMWLNFGINFDYNDAFTAPKALQRDVYCFGGTGNSFMINMWNTVS